MEHHDKRNMSPIILMNVLVVILLVVGCKERPVDIDTIPPGECPDGWGMMTEPHNPLLICFPEQMIEHLQTIGGLHAPPGDCPDGWKSITPPPTSILGCLPNNVILPSH